MDTILLRLLAAGIYEQRTIKTFQKDYESITKSLAAKAFYENKLRIDVPLTIRQLFMMGVVFGIGILFSTLAFSIEITSSLYERNKFTLEK